MNAYMVELYMKSIDNCTFFA